MDCAKLKADIERLQEARDAFDAAVIEANDIGLGKIKCNDAMKQASELEDEILQTYMEDMGEHNLELFPRFHYGEKIDGFHMGILSTLKISDNEVLVCGDEWETRILRKGEDGLWGYDSNNIGGFRAVIFSTLKLSDGVVLVCGGSYSGNKHSETRILRRGEDGLWNYDSDSIDGFDYSAMFSTLRLSDSEVLVCGGDGETRILRKSEDGSWNYDSNSVDGFDGTVCSALKLSDDEVLVCGGSGFEGETRILRRGEDGLWNYDSNRIDGFDGTVCSALKLSDDEVLVCGGGGKRGKTRILRKSEDGSWNYDSNSIDGFDDYVKSTLKLPDDEVLVCGDNGETRILHTDMDVDLDKLKQKLPDIAAKKDEA